MNALPHDGSLSTLLSLLAPRRVILTGSAGPLLRAVLDWARQNAGVVVLRCRGAASAQDGDLLVCEDATLLPEGGDAKGMALLPSLEVPVAEALGWSQLIGAVEQAAVLAPAESPISSLEMRLESYARARIVVSRELEAAGERGTNGRAPRPPIPTAGEVFSERESAIDPHAITIVLPVYNAADELRRCLYSLSQYTTSPCRLLIVDDASTEPEVANVLREAATLRGTRILRNAANLGFTATVNRAVRATRGDVVLLNSDTEVGPRWLEHLARAARSRPAVATVTPLSDNAGAFAVPTVGEANDIPLSLDLPGAARRIAQAELDYLEVPTGNGFCLYVTRAALNALGDFDAEAFPRGYGEENDFCMRALRAGWCHLLDPRTFVHHVLQASFGAERPQLMRYGRALVDSRYPEYTPLIRDFVASEQMAAVRAGVRAAYAVPAPPRPRILSIIHQGGGGTWIANLELMRALESEWEPLLLTSDRRVLRLWRMRDGELGQIEEWKLERPIRATDFSRADYVAILRSVLGQHEIELVHVRHLFKHTFDAPRVAADLGIPTVFSFHDFYFTCPTVHLLDDTHTYCAGQCTRGDGQCRIPDAGMDGLPHLKHSFVYQWREEVETMLREVDAFVTTSAHARSVHMRALPSLAGRPFELIEHGRALLQQSGIAVAPQQSGPIRILVVANLDVHKGAEYIRALRAADRDRRLEFHLLGAIPPEYSDLGICHGSFVPEELPVLAREIGPAFAGCFSIWAETYSHSLTEAWALGLPAIATDIGAPAERIRAHGGGQLIPLGEPEEAVRRIYGAAAPETYQQLRARASLRGCATVVDMADAYAGLYRRVADARRALPADSAGPVQLRPGVLRMLAVVPGSGAAHPGSTYVRVIQRYRHPSVSHKLSLSVRRADEHPLERDADMVLVQRTALDPATAEDFIAAARDRGLPLVLELDDHLLARPPDDPDYGAHQKALEALLDAAELVLVSTENLAEALEHRARKIAVVPNMIDERLFLTGVEDRPRSDPRPRPVQIVYIGSPTHGRDLALLRPVMERLSADAPGAFELNVVGVEPPGSDQEWYRRITVPNDCKPYPRFIAWLRQQRPAWDLAVAPLLDDEFNRYKSDLKFLEYAALGLPSVYSDREPYQTVTDRLTGLKVGDSSEEWAGALRVLAGDQRMSEAIALEAFREVTSGRLLRHGAESLLTLLCELVGTSLTAPPRRSGPPRAAAYDPGVVTPT